MIKEHLLIIIKKSGLNEIDLEKETGISRHIWGNLKTGKQRANEDHIEAITNKWPEYAYWITTGKTIPEAGQISPEIEETRTKLKEA